MEREPREDSEELEIGQRHSTEGAPGEIHEDGSYERTGDLIAPPQRLDVPGSEAAPASQGAGCGLVFIGGALLLLALFVVKCTGNF